MLGVMARQYSAFAGVVFGHTTRRFFTKLERIVTVGNTPRGKSRPVQNTQVTDVEVMLRDFSYTQPSLDVSGSATVDAGAGPTGA